MRAKTIINTLTQYFCIAGILCVVLGSEQGFCATISCGQTVANTTTTVSQVDQYTYAGTAGEQLFFALYGPLNCYSPYQSMSADIYNPSGQYLGTVKSGNCNTGADIFMILTNSGTFTILVHCTAYNATGNYSLSIQSVTDGGCNGIPIACGQTVNSHTSYNSEMDTYSYAGTAGEQLVFALYGPLNCYSPYQSMSADIYNPSGQYLGTVRSGNCNTGSSLNMTLTNSGTFTILVYCTAFNDTGNYSLSIQSVTGGGCPGTPIACGQTVNSHTSSNSEMDTYSYDGVAGQQLVFALYGPLNCYSPYQSMSADIHDPNGQYLGTVRSGNCNTGTSLGMTLTNTGIYTILVYCTAFNATGNYSLSIQSVTGGGCPGTPIACGQTVNSHTSSNSEMDTYSYDGVAGQQLVFALYGPLNCYSPYQSMSADIHDPNGQYLGTVRSGNCNTGTSLGMTLTNTGTYTILVYCTAFNATGNYSLSIQSVTAGGCDGTPIACGQTISTNTSFNTQMNAYSYVGTAGEQLVFALYGPLNCYSPYQTMSADIYNPDGKYLASVVSGNCNSGAALGMTLTNSGTFTILVHCAAYNDNGSYDLSIQSITGGGCGGGILCGATTTGQTSYPSQMNAYELVANAGEHVVLSDSGFSGMGVNVYDPNGSNVVSMGAPASTNLIFAETGIYTVLVYSGNFSKSGSYGLTETVFGGCAALPSVSVTPTGVVAASGSVATLTAVANGPTPLEYQWRLDNAPIAGATNSTYSIGQVQTTNSGSYVVVVSNPGGSVTSAPPALLAVLLWTNPPGVTYGTALGSNQLNATATVPGSYAYFPPSGTVLGAGTNTLSVIFSPSDTVDYSTVTDTVSLVVSPAALTVIASPQSKTYGQALNLGSSAFTASGLVNGDTVTSASLSSPGALSTAPVSGSPYVISITNALGDLGLTNYIITYDTGTLTVNPAPVTVTANLQSKIYGQTVNFGGGSTLFTPNGLQNGETIGTVTLSVSGGGGAPTAPVSGSPYTITPSAATGGTFNVTNYSITYAAGSLVVGTAPLTMTADPKTRGYGMTNPPLTYTITGYKNGENASIAGVTGAPTLSTTATTNSSVAGSPYTITCTIGTLAAPNYSFTTANGQLTVTPALLTVTADPKTRVYGVTNPPLTYAITGYQNGENATTAGVTGTPTLSTTATMTSSVGGNPYTINCTVGTLAAPNYNFAAANGQLTVTPATLGILSGLTANNKVYDGTTTATLSSNSVAFTGILNSDGPNVSLVTNGYTATFSSAEVGNNIAVTVTNLTLSGSAAANYALTQPIGLTASITVKAVTIASGLVADNKTYDATTTATLSSNNVMLSGIASEDLTNVWVVTNGYTAVFTNLNAGTNIGVTVDGLTLGGSAATNYTLAQTLELTANIMPRALSVTAVANTKTYDGTASAAAIPTITAGALQGNDTPNFTEAYADKNVGTGKTLTPSGKVNDGNGGNNYSNSFTAAPSGIISAHQLTVTAVPNTKVYDGTTSAAAIPTNTSGALQGSDTATFFETYADKNVGTNKNLTPWVTINDGNNGGNYDVLGINEAAGTITARSLTVSATGVNKVYDSTTAATVTLSDNRVAGDNLTESYASATFADKNVGTGKTVSVSGISVNGLDAPNYTPNTTATTIASITHANLSVTANNTNKIYGVTLNLGTTGFMTSGLLNGDTLTGVTLTSAGALAAASVAGSPYSVVPSNAVGTGLANYTINYLNGTLTLNQATLAISSGLTANNKVYDGTTTATLSSNSVAFTGILNSDGPNVSLATNGYTATFATAEVGTNIAVTVSNLTLTGSAATNYSLTQPTGLTASIMAKAVTIASGIIADNKTYDATTTALLSSNNVVLSGIASEDLTNVWVVTNGYTAVFTNLSAGNIVGVTINGLNLGGNAATNYTLAQPSGLTANIAPRALTVTAAPNTKTYDGTTSAAAIPTITSGALQGSDTPNFTETYADKDVGTGKMLTPSGKVNDGNGGNNYSNTFIAAASGIINQSPLTVTAVTNTKVYDGTTSASAIPTITSGALQASDTAVFFETYDNKNVGTGRTLTPSGTVNDGNGGNNYTNTFMAAATGVIKPLSLAVTANNASKTYGQNLIFTGSEFTSSGLIAGDSVMSVTLTSSGSATNATVTGSPYIIVPSNAVGIGISNYNISYLNGLLTVTKAALTVIANDASRPYGTTNPPFTGTLIGVMNRDNITASYNCLATITSPAGKTYPIVPSLTDPDNKLPNYSEASTDGELTITGIVITAPVKTGSTFILSVLTVNGNHYVLEYKNALTDPSWTAGQTNIGNGGIMTFTNPVGSHLSGFFRIQIQ